jgi:hypothetical protein
MTYILKARPAQGNARRAHRPPTMTSRIAGLALVACLSTTIGCGGPGPLCFVPERAPVGHDAEDVLDLAVIDIDGDGLFELIASRADGLHLLRRRNGRWQDATAGSGLDRIAPVDALVAVDRDLYATRDGLTVRLIASDIGTWSEAPIEGDAPPASAVPTPPGLFPVQVDADLDGDGALDRALVDGRIVRVLLRDMAGSLDDVTIVVASDALPLQGAARRIFAVDIDGDGDLDLVVAGGRILVLLSNGGVLEAHAKT